MHVSFGFNTVYLSLLSKRRHGWWLSPFHVAFMGTVKRFESMFHFQRHPFFRQRAILVYELACRLVEATPSMFHLLLLLIQVCARRPSAAYRYLGSNQLTGTLPSDLGALPRLKYMCVERDRDSTTHNWGWSKMSLDIWLKLHNDDTSKVPL